MIGHLTEPETAPEDTGDDGKPCLRMLDAVKPGSYIAPGATCFDEGELYQLGAT